MRQTTNEMSINLPIVSVEPVSSVESDGGYSTQSGVDQSVVIGSPDNSRHPSCINIYADSIAPSGCFDSDSELCTFDVVFNVGIREGDTSKTYKVVKRIAVDKVKLACDAECSSPVSVVEHSEAVKKAEAAATAKRFRILAGLE